MNVLALDQHLAGVYPWWKSLHGPQYIDETLLWLTCERSIRVR